MGQTQAEARESRVGEGGKLTWRSKGKVPSIRHFSLTPWTTWKNDLFFLTRGISQGSLFSNFLFYAISFNNLMYIKVRSIFLLWLSSNFCLLDIFIELQITSSISFPPNKAQFLLRISTLSRLIIIFICALLYMCSVDKSCETYSASWVSLQFLLVPIFQPL